MTHLNIRISGKVQGVYFRASAIEKAEELGLTGFVRNERDGSVYLEAEGPSEIIDQLVAWCKLGPPRSKVENVDVEEGDLKYFKSFSITR